MLRTSNTSLRVTLVLSIVVLHESGCLCPPCPNTPGAGAAAPAPPPPSAAATTEAIAAAPAAAVPARLVLWDGDKTGAGQAWASCNKKPECKVSFSKAAGAGIDGTVGLKFHGEGPDWIGGGWNWFGWYPETAGTDISPYRNLTFQIRVEAKSADAAPEPSSVAVILGCSKGTKNSADAPVQRYAADFANGQWHKVSIPIADLTSGTGAAFDPKTAWEFRVATWSGPPRDFNIYVDDIAVEK
jgi:hypothetical protein